VKPIRVLVADDSTTLRTALVALLGEDKRLSIVGQAADGVEAVDKARTLRPDVITMDVNMPRLDGLGATAAIMAEAPSRVLVISSVRQHRQLELIMERIGDLRGVRGPVRLAQRNVTGRHRTAHDGGRAPKGHPEQQHESQDHLNEER